MTNKTENKVLVKKLLGLVAMMSVFVFAMIPLYDIFCEITGINGGVVNKALYETVEKDTSRTVTIEFVTDINSGMPWDFGTKTKKIEVFPGELNEVMFYAKNKSSKVITGQAVPSISPGKASFYVSKTECFCFEQQTLMAGEAIDMPMKFYIDPDLPDNVHTVTLSYILFNATPQSSETVAAN